MSTSEAAAGAVDRAARSTAGSPSDSCIAAVPSRPPARWDAYRGQLGVNEVNFAIRTTGMLGLVFLIAVAARHAARAGSPGGTR